VQKSVHSPEQRILQSLLKTMREEKGIQQKDFAALLQRPASYVSRYEHGEKMLNLPELLQIARALETDLPTLIGRYQAGLEAQGLWEPLKK
jgi:transcriptional regulator with XRE-family HTH domain